MIHENKNFSYVVFTATTRIVVNNGKDQNIKITNKESRTKNEEDLKYNILLDINISISQTEDECKWVPVRPRNCVITRATKHRNFHNHINSNSNNSMRITIVS